MNLIDNLLTMNPAIGWAALGVILLIAEVFSTTSFIIPFAIAAFLTAILAWMLLLPMGLLWQGLVFAVLGAALIPVCRRVLLRFSSKTPDINQY